jgi:hypothetical protein
MDYMGYEGWVEACETISQIGVGGWERKWWGGGGSERKSGWNKEIQVKIDGSRVAFGVAFKIVG